MIKKIISFETKDKMPEGNDTRSRVARGAITVADMVGRTLGPGGRNALIYKNYKSPPITNDGVTVARHTTLEDEVEDLGAQVMVEACMKTNETAGDGTSTTAVIAGALLRSVYEKINKNIIGNETNVVLLGDEIQKEAKIVVEKIKERSREAGADDLKNVAVTSMRNEEDGMAIAEVVKKVGVHGYVSIEDNWYTKYSVDTELSLGMRHLGTYASPYFSNNNNKEAIWVDTQILVCNDPIDSPNAILQLIKDLGQLEVVNKNLVIFNGYENTAFSKPFIVGILNTTVARNKGESYRPHILLVKCPALTSEELEDVACFCDAKFVDRNKGMKLTDVRCTTEWLGFAKKVVVDEDNFSISGGRGKVDERIAVLTEHMNLEKDMMFKNKTKKRISALAAGMAIIRVGAATEQERTFKKDKMEDAKNATKAAMEEGVVEGGGQCLMEIAEELGENNILYKALRAPYERIMENAGGIFIIPETVLDSTKVTRLAVQNACSIIAKLITVDIVIAEKRVELLDKFEEIVKKQFRGTETDWRADENQDINLG